MKKSTSRVISFVLALLTILSAAAFPLTVFAEKVTSTREDITVTTGTSGATNYFKEDTYYDLPKLDATPLTYEFEVAVPKDGITGKGVYGGVILGNYGLDGTRCISIEIHEYGKVRFYTNTSSGNVDIKFSNQTIDVRKGTTLHIAITVDTTTGTATLYVNGTQADVQTNAKLKNLPKASDFPFNFRIGGDHRSGNVRHFEGAIDSVALFSDVRTAEEIAQDVKKAKSWGNEENLIAAYDLTKQGDTALKDYSGNGKALTYTNGSGALLKNYGTYNIANLLRGTPETLEAWVFLPDFYGGRGGSILANDDNDKSKSPDVMFEIENDGHPRLSYTTETGTASHEFGKVDVRTGTWQHVTIVHDVANKEARCYINGALAETLAYTEAMENDNGGAQTPVEAYHSDINDSTYVLGGTNQKGNPLFFKGFLKEVRVYSDVRSDAEIAADYQGSVDTTDAELMAYYLISEEILEDGNIEDISGNGYTATLDQLMFDTTDPIDDYAYSIAVVGDTQTITNHNSAKLKDLYQWIVDNQEARNIQYVIGLGDITERGDRNGSTYVNEETARKQWQAAKDAITLMDGNVPYTLIRGAGHDGLDFFDEYFADHSAYTDNIAGYYTEGSVENVYHTFRVASTDYLILCLEFGAKDDVLAWANEVVAAHPYHRVIVTTHGYLEKDGSFLEGHETYAPSRYDPESNDGDDIWNKFVRKHANIIMVMSGHMSANDVIVSEMVGDNGNVVQQLLINPQSMDSSSSLKGMVAMLYFSADGESVQVEYYSTLTGTWRPNSTFSISYAGQTETPYGNIPDEYKDIDKNPVLVFNAETGEVVYGGTQLHTTTGAIQYCVSNGGKHIIYLRKSISCYSNTSIGDLNGELVIDLGGNTVYEKGAFLEFQGKSSVATTVTIKNGTLDMSNDNASFIGVGGKYGNGKKTNHITVENVTFKSLTQKLVYEAYGDAVNTTSTILFKDCRFEVAAGKADKLIPLGSHSTNTRVSVTFAGGKFIFAGAQCDIYTNGGVNLKYVYFAKNASGAYPTVTMPSNGVSTDSFTTSDGTVLGLHKISENATSVTYRLAPFAITGAYLNLTNDINVLYSATVPTEYKDPYMVFEFNGNLHTVSDYTVAEDGEWLFAFEGVTPQMVGENIKATLIATKDGVEKRVEKAEYSVLTYCKNMLNKTTDAKLKTLLSDLLVYAAASQTYMDYKTDALVTEGLSLTPSTFAPLASTDKALHGTEDARVEWKGAALRYENAMAMKFNFKADKALTLKITVGKRSEIYTSDDWETDENGNYVVYFRGILATEYDDVVTAVLYENDAQVGEIVTYSVNSYVYSMQNEGGTLGALVQATYNYGASAENYN